MKVLNKITLDKKSIKELVYQGINYAFWYYAYTLPILYTKGYQESLEEIGISMEERKAYTRNMHEILGRMPFDELMKQSPRYVFKSTFGRNPLKDIILWANETGYEYDNYKNNIIKEYIEDNGMLNIRKLEANYELLEKNYANEFEEFCTERLEQNNICNLVENNELLKCFVKSDKIYINAEYCIIVNRLFDEKQNMKSNSVMLIKSYVYTDEYRIENFQKKLTTTPEQYFNNLGYDGEFNKANFTYACVDNFERTKEYNKEIINVTIRSENYVLESLSRIKNVSQIQKLCGKTFIFMESVENRAAEIQCMYAYMKYPKNVTYEEVINYRKEMNNENFEQYNIG